jgi:signal transduction histidine kinase/tetratricopeptide (TPR) repeat protein
MSRYRYKQTLLILAILILPSVAIGLLGWRDFTREREKQLRDAEERTEAYVRQTLLQVLERIKLQEISGAPSDPAVVLVASVEADRLKLPWDADPSADRFRESLEEPNFAQKILQARLAEGGQKRYDQAIAIYRELIQSTRSENQRTYARFLLSGLLTRSGQEAEALPTHRDLLKLPLSAVDEHGVPFAYYVAQRMASAHRADPEVLTRVARDLNSPASVPPQGMYVLQQVLETLRQSGEAEVVQGARQALDELAGRVKYVEQASALQKEFPSLHLTSADWQPYRPAGAAVGDTWLVSLTPSGAESAPLIVAVSATQIFRSVESTHRSAGSDLLFEIGVGGAGELLGENLPGVRCITFRPYARAGVWTSIISQRPVYILSLFCVVVLTFLGGYLLWRDTRREIRLAELRTQFVSSVSHELKTPLTAIRMFAEIMQMQGPGDPQKHAEHLDTIVNETERLTRLLNNVLDFSRIERGQRQYNMQSASLVEIVNTAARTMRYTLAESGFDFRVDVAEEIPVVRVDRDALEQAILNLLSNAMKYSGQSREIDLRLFTQNGSAVIQVSDHGIGIPVQEQRRIFEKFYRVPTRENRAISGTGLGLALVAHIAESHRGHVEVDSSPGKGSTFSICLPMDAESYS